MNDLELLEEYARTRSDEAFRALVGRHLRLVFGACWRQLGDRQLAEDATQAVFVVLSRKAGRLRERSLEGWLLTTARYACSTVRRTRLRQQQRERVTAMTGEKVVESEAAAASGEMLAVLDEGLCRLKPGDREAVVLRYMKEQPLNAVGGALGVSEEAARKRVDRAIDKLRRFFEGKGVKASGAVVVAVLAEQAKGTGGAGGVGGAVMSVEAEAVLVQGIVAASHATTGSVLASLTIVKGMQMQMLMGKLAALGAAAVIGVAVGGSAWVGAAALAARPAAGPMVTRTGSTTAPAIASDVDLSTPEKALAAVSAALKAGDREKVYACLAVEPNREPTAWDALIGMNLADTHMQRASSRAFGAGVATPRMTMPIENFLELLLAVKPPVQVEGERASMPYLVPQELLNQLPADYLVVVKPWQGKPVRFKKKGAQWQVDLDGTAQVVLSVPQADPLSKLPVEERLKRMAAWGMEYAKAVDEVAARIEKGELTTLKDTHGEMQAKTTPLFEKYGISRSLNMDVLPLEGGAAMP